MHIFVSHCLYQSKIILYIIIIRMPTYLVHSEHHRTANFILPSYLKRKRPGDKSISKRKSSNRDKQLQVWDRDIICLPKPLDGLSSLSYPRGKQRSRFVRQGLIGKVRLTSTMTVDEVEEVRSVFDGPMSGRRDFPFMFLQPSGAGSRSV